MDNYYSKYIKYKNKYLELKKQHGGYVGTTSCMFALFTTSPWHVLREYNCMFSDIEKKFPKELENLTYAEFIDTNSKFEHIAKQIEVKDLRKRGFTASFLIKAGFPLDVLKDAGFSAKELIDTGVRVSATDLKKLGFNINDLICIFPSFELNNKSISEQLTFEDIIIGKFKCNGRNATQLKNPDYNYNAEQLRKWFSLNELKEAGFTTQQLKEAGFTIQQLTEARFTIQQLTEAGFTIQQLKEAGFTIQQLTEAGLILAE